MSETLKRILTSLERIHTKTGLRVGEALINGARISQLSGFYQISDERLAEALEEYEKEMNK